MHWLDIVRGGSVPKSLDLPWDQQSREVKKIFNKISSNDRRHLDIWKNHWLNTQISFQFSWIYFSQRKNVLLESNSESESKIRQASSSRNKNSLGFCFWFVQKPDSTRSWWSIQVVCLNMISYITNLAFLSTHFANKCFLLDSPTICQPPIWDHVLFFLSPRKSFHRVLFGQHQIRLGWQQPLQCFLQRPLGRDYFSLFVTLGLEFVWAFSIFILLVEDWPISHFNLSSSAIAKNDSKLSWWTVASL